MVLTNYKYQSGDSFPHAIAEGYKEAEKYWGIPGAANGAGQYAMHNKGRTGAIALVTLSVVALTAAYFLSPAYATFVGTSVAKAATLVSPAITAMSALAVAHPLVASLVVLAAVAVLVTAVVLVCKNNDKATQIKCMENQVAKIKEAVFDACEKEDNKPKVDNGKLTLANDKDPSSVLYGVAEAVGLVKAQVNK